MEIHLLRIFAFLTLALAASRAALPPEEYWNSVLANTPMPKAISDLLRPDLLDEKNTAVNVGKRGVNVDSDKAWPFYLDAASETQLHDDPTAALFLLEKDMHPGTKMNLLLTKSTDTATFLPRQVAKSIPFSSNKLQEILNLFSVKRGSPEADIMENTIEECERPGVKEEEKYCATSLESMVDFSTSKLGKDVLAISTESGKETQLKKYTILPGVKKITSKKAVVCHKLNYAYAVFYCHATHTIRVYQVPLEGVDGTKAEAVAVCHTDTSAWNPKFLAFQVLKVKPGTVPVCHFLLEDHVVWTSN